MYNVTLEEFEEVVSDKKVGDITKDVVDGSVGFAQVIVLSEDTRLNTQPP